MTWIVLALGVAAAAPAALRFLRVAQREHYLGGSTIRFALRWWTGSRNVWLFVAGIVGLAATPWWWWMALVPIGVAALGPLGLGVRGVSSPLRWTGRLRRLTAIVSGSAALLIVASVVLEFVTVVAAILALGMPLLIDLGLALAAPLEARLGRRWIDKARDKLNAVDPRILAITGSYGKTTTKEYARLLLAAEMQVVASPASFNNAMGLARAINEHLTPGSELFIAEMGAYGPGEIAALCSWIPPEVAIITAIGPVHLERFGSLERTLEAKSEILEGAGVAVLNIDDRRLAGLADRQAGVRRVIRCSAIDTSADVCVLGHNGVQEVWAGGALLARLDPPVAFATNVACAIGAALAFGVDPGSIRSALAGADRPAHRQTLTQSDLGFTIIDDTYNSNPAGASAGLQLLGEIGSGARRVLVTPGMVELGADQVTENARLAAQAVEVATDILIVGLTNRRALLKGTEGGRASVMVVDSRPEAVEWVRANLGRGDVVLYENDLPDHYP
ncbi:MAG: UDP-N-acetylmuramoyl-tripeptide--D-alanyl-D-alanine ligase [Acidimicrobiia bacterium]|nr:UDP-N-acetylmuramoyl-tripeptide--D-alanyl-D-alanine ligase [Acidimicrobiia bacterium]